MAVFFSGRRRMGTDVGFGWGNGILSNTFWVEGILMRQISNAFFALQELICQNERPGYATDR
jgi:hypothetical protein